MTASVAIGLAVGVWAHRGLEPGSLLATGRAISPTGTQTDVGSFPANMVLSPDGKFIAVADTGFRQSLSVLDAASGKVLSQLSFNGGGNNKPEALYYGLAFAGSSGGSLHLYVSRGPEDRASVFSVDSNGVLRDEGHAVDNSGSEDPNNHLFMAGIALNSTGDRLYAADNMTSALTHGSGSLSVLDVKANKLLGRVRTAGFPYAVASVTRGVLADKKVYVASERDGVVESVDVTDASAPRIKKKIVTGDHPISLLLNKDQSTLFVANAGSDTVSVIDTLSDRVVTSILLRPEGARLIPGVSPTGLALSPDGGTLFASLGDMNAVAVVDVPKASLKGYIPVGWYPTSVVVSADGKRLFVANAKGVLPKHPNKSKMGPKGEWGTYTLNIIEGTVSSTPVPSDDLLETYTRQVLANNHVRPNMHLANRNVLSHTGIKHVVYIVKENRSYDQVMGDMAGSDGDPSLTIFGKDVTPNEHALAARFILLDGFYCAAEASGDGWNWSTSGMASEYTVRNVPFVYGDRGRQYDFEGLNNDSPVDIEGIPDVARAPGGYIWDLAAAKGLSYRNYGFFTTVGDTEKVEGRPPVEDNKPTKRALAGHTDEDYYRFDMAYADSEAWLRYDCPNPKQRRSYGSHNAPSRYSEWKFEFDAFVRKKSLPAFTMIRLPRDHTQGTVPGQSTPRAMVADNDYAVGQIVEAISHSPFWNDTAIFILEDDAQSGQDHVDSHRSTCFVVSSHIKRGRIDHRFYNTDSVLRTMEALLGLPPMSQYDASAPLLSVFESRSVNPEPYRAILPAREIIAEVNKSTAYRAKESSAFDFSHEDRVPEEAMADILWHSVKGARVPAPRLRDGLRLGPDRLDDHER